MMANNLEKILRLIVNSNDMWEENNLKAKAAILMGRGDASASVIRELSNMAMPPLTSASEFTVPSGTVRRGEESYLSHYSRDQELTSPYGDNNPPLPESTPLKTGYDWSYAEGTK